jgi:hypothetical protein
MSMLTWGEHGSSRARARNTRCCVDPLGTMAEATSMSRGGLELLANDLVDLAVVAV